MHDYFLDDTTKTLNESLEGSSKKLNESCGPIVPSRETWEVFQSPERLSKVYAFDSKARLADFVLEILSFENRVNHSGTIKISGSEVTIEVYTHDVNRITNLDREYAQSADAIFYDVSQYGY